MAASASAHSSLWQLHLAIYVFKFSTNKISILIVSIYFAPGQKKKKKKVEPVYSELRETVKTVFMDYLPPFQNRS